MARKQVVSYTITCDVCGESIPDTETDDATRKFGLEGSSYTVDICATHRQELSDVLEKLKTFVDAGSRQAPGGRRRTGASAPRARRARAGSSKAGSSGRPSEVAAIRTWAVDNGYRVGVRGRIPGTITAAYHEAESARAAATPPARRRRKAPLTATATSE